MEAGTVSMAVSRQGTSSLSLSSLFSLVMAKYYLRHRPQSRSEESYDDAGAVLKPRLLITPKLDVVGRQLRHPQGRRSSRGLFTLSNLQALTKPLHLQLTTCPAHTTCQSVLPSPDPVLCPMS
ncbi:hypothetical protein TcWFU_005629 [Taenia crassiceps]|uniref:Uncharacterized protein n=1 Tax=Taenia crassiceps TaxID=6207 RepID=A0ABR4Q1N0_9CEST